MKIVIAESYAQYRNYCDHRRLNRAEHKFVSHPGKMRGLSLAGEDIHIASSGFPSTASVAEWQDALASVEAGHALNG